MTVQIGPELRRTAIVYYARYEEWPLSLTLVLGKDPVPAWLEREAKAERLLEVRRSQAVPSRKPAR